MNTQTPHDQTRCRHRLHFRPLYGRGPGLAFPCDAKGAVDLRQLGETARRNYFHALERVGDEFLTPEVEEVHL